MPDEIDIARDWLMGLDPVERERIQHRIRQGEYGALLTTQEELMAAYRERSDK